MVHSLWGLRLAKEILRPISWRPSREIDKVTIGTRFSWRLWISQGRIHRPTLGLWGKNSHPPHLVYLNRRLRIPQNILNSILVSNTPHFFAMQIFTHSILASFAIAGRGFDIVEHMELFGESSV